MQPWKSICPYLHNLCQKNNDVSEVINKCSADVAEVAVTDG